MKRIEREFTQSNARKDVIYKAILRFFRRSCTGEVRGIGEPCRWTDEKRAKESERYLSALSLTPTGHMSQVLQVIIDPNACPTEGTKSLKSAFTTVMGKFNRKKLASIFKNKDFALIFTQFWKRQKKFSSMVESLNFKRTQDINQEAYRYYLDKLLTF